MFFHVVSIAPRREKEPRVSISMRITRTLRSNVIFRNINYNMEHKIDFIHFEFLLPPKDDTGSEKLSCEELCISFNRFQL